MKKIKRVYAKSMNDACGINLVKFSWDTEDASRTWALNVGSLVVYVVIGY